MSRVSTHTANASYSTLFKIWSLAILLACLFLFLEGEGAMLVISIILKL